MPVIVTPKPAPPAQPKPATPDEPASRRTGRRASGSGVGSRRDRNCSRDSRGRRVAPPWPVGRRVRPRRVHWSRRDARAKFLSSAPKVSHRDRKKSEGGPAERARPADQARADAEVAASRSRGTAADGAAGPKAGHEVAGRRDGRGKAGSKPLAAHLRRHERTLEEERDERGLARDCGRQVRRSRACELAAGRRRRGKGGRRTKRRSRRQQADAGWARAAATRSAVATPTPTDGEDRPVRQLYAGKLKRDRREHCRAAQGARHDSICPARSASFRKRPAFRRRRFCAFS